MKVKSFSLGNFDGVHLGHLAVIERVCALSKESALLTFSNHPAVVLKGSPPPLLTSTPHKLKLISEAGIRQTILLPFTKELSQKTAGEFLKEIHASYPFTHLVLGHDAHFGHNRDGVEENLRSIGQKLGFSLEYLPPVIINGSPISSSRIRNLLKEGQIEEAKALLGRPFSIYGEVIHGKGLGKKLGFPTANMALPGGPLLPLGVYSVSVIYENALFKGVANLGVAPTIPSNDPTPILEVHLIDTLPEGQSYYGKTMNVQFNKFLRPEEKFPSLEALKRQIEHDISVAHYLKN